MRVLCRLGSGWPARTFALDAPVNVPPGADRARVLDAAKGHVPASGEIVAPFQKPDN